MAFVIRSLFDDVYATPPGRLVNGELVDRPPKGHDPAGYTPDLSRAMKFDSRDDALKHCVQDREEVIECPHQTDC